MDIEEVKDSGKSWLDNRLKNPYFASVIAVWLFTNRVVIFGLFNFDENQNLEQRVSWVQQQLQHSEALGFIHGFYWIILYSLIMGLVTMLGFKYLKVLGEATYKKLGKWAINYQAKINPNEWHPNKDVEELEVKYKNEIKEFQARNSDLMKLRQDSELETRRFKEEKDTALTELVRLQHKKKEEEDLAMQMRDTNSSYAKRIGELNTEHDKLIGQARNLAMQNESLQKENKILAEQNGQLVLDSRNEEINNTIDNNGTDNVFGQKQEKTEAQKKLHDAFKTMGEETKVKKFLNSEYAKYFNEIFDSIINHQPLGLSISNRTRGFYLSEGLISVNGNLFVLTPKGEEYYKEYLKVKGI